MVTRPNKRQTAVLVGIVLLLGAALCYGVLLQRDTIDTGNAIQMHDPVRIRPDYSDTVIPPNIAPLNFSIQRRGIQYYVKIRSDSGDSIDVLSRTPGITIPLKPWQTLLHANRGCELVFDISVRNIGNQWEKYAPITNLIASEDVDRYVAYRRIKPLYNYWKRTGVFQRDLENYEEQPMLRGQAIHDADLGSCVNCHSFCNYRSDKVLISIRDATYGSSALLAQGGRVDKIDTKFGYTSWHPSGNLFAYSVNKVRQFFHLKGTEIRDVVDLDGYIAYYVLDTQELRTHSRLSEKDRLETYPCWSPDGRYLYYSSARIPWEDRNKVPPKDYDKVWYDLMRIGYNMDQDTWGEPELLLSGQDRKKSMLIPRVSPDGRYLLFSMCDYGCFPVFQPTSDLYMIDLESAEKTGTIQEKRLDINSDRSESWHSWSTNSRWIVFTSKRDSGLFARLYISHVDQLGEVHKPILLPQERPDFYDSCIETYNTPEFTIERISIRERDFIDAVRTTKRIKVDLPITGATRKVAFSPGQIERE